MKIKHRSFQQLKVKEKQREVKENKEKELHECGNWDTILSGYGLYQMKKV